ncbi:hypothetical protein XpopCFBP1817_07030, partial [Xanthomonas populi]
ESVFGLTKRERIRRRVYPTNGAARAEAFDDIEMFYNPKRRHGCNDNLHRGRNGLACNGQRRQQQGGEQCDVSDAQHAAIIPCPRRLVQQRIYPAAAAIIR